MEHKHTIRILFLTILAEVIGLGILIPIVPLLFTEPSSQFFMLGSGSITLGYILLGLTVGLYPLAQFFSTPILGELSDIYGRKRVIQLSVIGTIAATLIFAFGILKGSVAVLLASRALNGATGGLISVAQATIADVSEQNSKSKNFGIIGAAFGTGFIIGPFLGGVLSSDLYPFLNPATPFFFAASLSALSLLYVSLKLRETSPMEKSSINWKKPFSQVVKGLKLPGLKKLFGTSFFYFAGFAFYTTFLPVYLIKRFGFSQFQVGNTYLYLGVFILLTQLVIVPRLFKRCRETRVMPLTLFLTGFFILSLILAPEKVIFFGLLAFFAVNNSISMVSIQTLISNKAPEKDQGLALGTNRSVRAMATAFPAMLSGFAAALSNPGIPLVIAGSIIMATALIYSSIR
ncbi:MAG: MFS transporter [Candidatus Nanohaloarchaea archaeon]